MPLDPEFYIPSQNQSCYPPRPLTVVGFAFDPATGTFDFSGVPGFDLSRLQSIWHANSERFLYARPINRGLDLAEVDGVAVPTAPTSGTVLRVRATTAGIAPTDEVLAFYDLD